VHDCTLGFLDDEHELTQTMLQRALAIRLEKWGAGYPDVRNLQQQRDRGYPDAAHGAENGNSHQQPHRHNTSAFDPHIETSNTQERILTSPSGTLNPVPIKFENN
jgi:hypothetical protein